MITGEMIADKVASYTKEFNEKVAALNKKVAAHKKLAEAGFDLVKHSWDLSDCGSYHINRDQLPALRKVVGRLQVTSKAVPYDYDQTRELVVSVRAMSDEFKCIPFVYRTPHRGTKCIVKDNVYTSRSLVCQA